MAVVSIETMECAPFSARKPATWQFYADAAQMNDWYDQHAPKDSDARRRRHGDETDDSEL
jgi:hypothetical protein